MICYGLMSIGLVLATVILLSLAYGFGIGSNGKIVQNGRVYTGTLPTGASVYVNDQLQGNKTNTSLLFEAGRYTLRYEKDGYRSWQHSMVINGGVNVRYDYALLVPTQLQPESIKTFDGQVTFASQSQDKRWLLVQSRGGLNEFLRYDLKDPKSLPVVLEVPDSILTQPSQTQQWTAASWADDNRHVLLTRSFTATGQNPASGQEQILYDVSQPDEPQNLTTLLDAAGKTIELRNDKYDSYYIFDQSAHTLTSATLDNPEPAPLLQNVAAYKSYGNSRLLYVDVPEEAADVAMVHEFDGKTTYDFGSIQVSDTYLLNFTQHKDNWYVAFGARAESRVAVYKNPIASLQQLPNQPLVPVQVLKVTSPVTLEFSANARFLMANGGQEFYVYDVDDDRGYQFTAEQPIDTSLPVSWMDGYRITEVSSGRLTIFDYDNTNLMSLQAVDPTLPVFFSPDMKYVYSFVLSSGSAAETGTIAGSVLQRTALRIPADM